MIVVLPAALAGAKRAGGDKSERQHVTAPDGRRFSHKTEYGDLTEEMLTSMSTNDLTFTGDFPGVVARVRADSNAAFLRGDPSLDVAQVEVAARRRVVLMMTEALEGWAVQLARWLLELGATGRSNQGAPHEFLAKCGAALDPPATALIARARASGVVHRRDLATAIAQCLTGRHRLVRGLHEAGARLNEYTRYYWTALHFAAAFGPPEIVRELLALGANPKAQNGAGHTPLHVAVQHRSWAAAAALATTADARRARDHMNRTAEDLALTTMLTVETCVDALEVVAVEGGGRARYEQACREVAEWRREEREMFESDDHPAPHEACAAGGGWRGDHAAAAAPPRHCEIPIVRDLPTESLQSMHLAAGLPVLVTGADVDTSLYDTWERDPFAQRHGAVELNLDTYPYASTSAPHYMVPVNRTSLAQLLGPGGPAEFLQGAARRALPPARKGERPRPPEKPRSVFQALSGWRHVSDGGISKEGAGSAKAKKPRRRWVRGDIELTFAKQPKRDDAPSGEAPGWLLRDWSRPSFVVDPAIRTTSIQFYLGPEGSGAQPHWHSAAWNWLVHGRKKWLLWPPHEAAYAQRHVTASLDALPTPIVCEQRAGDVLVVPELWGHATLNLEPGLGWATEMRFDRVYDSGITHGHGDEEWRLRGKKAVRAAHALNFDILSNKYEASTQRAPATTAATGRRDGVRAKDEEGEARERGNTKAKEKAAAKAAARRRDGGDRSGGDADADADAAGSGAVPARPSRSAERSGERSGERSAAAAAIREYEARVNGRRRAPAAVPVVQEEGVEAEQGEEREEDEDEDEEDAYAKAAEEVEAPAAAAAARTATARSGARRLALEVEPTELQLDVAAAEEDDDDEEAAAAAARACALQAAAARAEALAREAAAHAAETRAAADAAVADAPVEGCPA